MKILIATPLFPPDIGGPATYSKTIAEKFFELGHQVWVVGYEHKNSKLKTLHRRRIRLWRKNSKPQPKTKNYKLIMTSRKLSKGVRHIVYFWKVLLWGFNADVIYAQDPVSVGFPSAIASALLRKPFVLKVVGDYAWEQGAQRFGVQDLLDDFLGKKYGFRVEFLRWLEKFVAKRARVIIVPSQYLKSVVERWGIGSKKIKVIYNSAYVPAVLQSKEEAKKELGLQGKVLISVGRLVLWKGFEMLIEIMPKISAKYPDAKLLIIGSGPQYKNLESKILNLESKTKLLGSINKNEVLKYLRAADIFLLNTGYEGFSHQILEAMAVGVPIISTNAGGNKEILENGRNALIVGCNDKDGWVKAISELLDNPTLAKSLADNAQKDIQKFTGKNMTEETINILKQYASS